MSIVEDPGLQLGAEYRSKGTFAWPGALGTTWFADPVENLIGIMLIQRRSIEPFPVAKHFERTIYAAIDD